MGVERGKVDGLATVERPVVAEPILFGELVKGKVQFPEIDLNLQEAPVYLYCQEKPELGQREFLALVDKKLESESFLELLHEVSPYKEFNHFGITEDWELIIPNTRVYLDLDNYALRSRHEFHLREAFEKFKEHVLDFHHTLLGDENLFREARYTADTFAFDEASSKSFYGLPQDLLDFTLESKATDSQRQMLTNFIRDNFAQRVYGRDARELVESVFYWTFHNKKSLTRDFIKSMNHVETRRLLGLYWYSFGKMTAYGYPFAKFEFDSEHDEVRFGDFEDRIITFQFEKLIRLKANLSQSQRGPVDGRDLYFKVLPESIESFNFLVPIIRWSLDNAGNRRYQLEFVDGSGFESEVEDFVDSQLPKFEGLEFDRNRLNPLVGLLTIAAISPEITGKWPEYRRLESYKPEQKMRGGQVPVMAIERSYEFLESPFFERAEEHLNKTAA